MLTVVVSVVLTAAALAGMTLMIFTDSLLTVDGLFLTLVLGSIAAIFAFNSFHTLRRLRALRVSAQQVKPALVARADLAVPVKPSAPAPVHGTARLDASATTVAPASQTASPMAPAKPARHSQQKARSIEGLITGSVLIKNGTPIPDAVLVQPRGKWKLVECDSAAALERPLSEAGLAIFFPVGGALAGSAWALDRKQAVTKALGSVLSAVEAQGRNAVEIARISAVNVLGLHHVTVIARRRHIQKAAFFLEPAGTPQAAHSAPPSPTLPAMNSRGRAA